MTSDKSKNLILLYRLIFGLLGWFTILATHYIQITGMDTLSIDILFTIVYTYRYFTMQTNLLVLIWWSLAIYSYRNPEILEKIMGPIKGALTLCISITFLIYAIILAPLHQPTGFSAFINLVTHYITPIAFIIDWIITEREKLTFQIIIYWLIYPFCYLIFAVVHGLLTENFLYPFLALNTLGPVNFVISVSFVVLLFIGLSCLYVIGSRYKYKIYNPS